ncbi:hypothetical protein GYMC10_4371 [Paenibacillus sp. Y412MC10]|nr:hypothetical protein GYMC10_4371 [Paenibacillus sp. Y412MC10]
MEHLFQELLQHYFHGPVSSIETVPFGMTNDSRIVVMNQNKYVARIYNRHTKNEERLRFEVGLTAYLESCCLSFDVPCFVSSKDDAKYVVLSDGSLGSLTRFIEGEALTYPACPMCLVMGGQLGKYHLLFNNSNRIPLM